ncbi:unnamed protein product [Acanthoscelides obtectus]|uniref:Uncharacterized protein n=1 Tax=Acanthoscelides obtectus TaxID=200917 RepID=A0A9P0PAQ6_ACAOB|nr:unnamed protein product [Acanthoscelides obtectus]CAK1631840.1 hypothetical protein AOBTE_LOCUS7193 [Acanthoscelides obtectus]
MTHSNITNGFRATGLFPLNSQAIPETAFAPSILSAVAQPAVEAVANENVLNPSSKASSSRKMPRTTEGRHIQKEAKWSDEDEVPLAKLKNKLNEAAKYHQPSTSRQAAERTPSKFSNEARSSSSKNIGDGKKHFYSLVSSSDSSEGKADEVDETTLDTSFHELLPTPINQTEKAHPIKKKQ